MLRAVVLCTVAIEVNVSPRLTTYARNVGCGVGVGRTNDGRPDGAGVGDAVTAATAGLAVGPSNVASGRSNAAGMHATTITDATTAAAMAGHTRMCIAAIVP